MKWFEKLKILLQMRRTLNSISLLIVRMLLLFLSAIEKKREKKIVILEPLASLTWNWSVSQPVCQTVTHACLRSCVFMHPICMWFPLSVRVILPPAKSIVVMSFHYIFFFLLSCHFITITTKTKSDHIFTIFVAFPFMCFRLFVKRCYHIKAVHREF